MQHTESTQADPIFPPDFVWGVATSSFQIEGAATLDGKGPSNWDRFCRVPGAIADGSNGDVACDHVNRLEQDLDLIQGLGVDAYRFSVSWPRVQPTGEGAWNPAGLAFYERLVDGLLARGVQPYLTLNHWDLPDALQQQGGWMRRDTVHRFVDYAQGINARLGDRIGAMTTHNEPWVMAMLGHEMGEHPPGLKSRAAAVQAAHHLLLSHGLALQALRAQGGCRRLGIVLNLSPVVPASEAPADVAQARFEDGRLVRWYTDPLFKAAYPADIWDWLGADAPVVQQGDLQAIAQPLDFLGINYYSRNVAQAGTPFKAGSTGLPVTEMGWEVIPSGLTDLLLRLHRDYPLPPTYITENGAAFADTVSPDGAVHDPARTAYIAQHIAAVGEALRQGVPMAGYLVWSLLDNFEWAYGYSKRFGIVRVDYDTQQRTLKDSALWYREFLAQHRALRQARAVAAGAVQAVAAGAAPTAAALVEGA